MKAGCTGRWWHTLGLFSCWLGPEPLAQVRRRCPSSLLHIVNCSCSCRCKVLHKAISYVANIQLRKLMRMQPAAPGTQACSLVVVRKQLCNYLQGVSVVPGLPCQQQLGLRQIPIYSLIYFCGAFTLTFDKLDVQVSAADTQQGSLAQVCGMV